MNPKQCPVCDTVFIPVTANQKYCGRWCRDKDKLPETAEEIEAREQIEAEESYE